MGGEGDLEKCPVSIRALRQIHAHDHRWEKNIYARSVSRRKACYVEKEISDKQTYRERKNS